MQAKLEISLQLQIFGQELLGAILGMFPPLLCKQIVVSLEKGQVSLAAFTCLLSLGN